MTLPTLGYISLDAMIRTIYRMKVSKEHLLEWTTSEEAERQSKNSFLQVFTKMLPNTLVGLLIFVLIPYTKCSIFAKGLILILGVLFFTAPFLMMDISRKKIKKKMILKLNGEEQSYIKGVAEKTWGYFAEYMNQENSYLPPDNYQESRREKIVCRTSSTNIGLGILAVISAYDLKFIQLDNYRDDGILFQISNTNEEDSLVNYNDNVFFTDCSNPISLGFVNKDLLTGCEVNSTNGSITFDGSILRSANIQLEDINPSISFTIHLTNNYNEKFTCNVDVDVDLSASDGGIYNGYIMKVINCEEDKYNFLKVSD